MFGTPSVRRRTLNAIPPEPETPAPESAAQRTERHVRQCRRMAELGMKLAEATAQKALRDQARRSADPAAPAAKDPAVTFARITNTIHQAIKLEAKLTAPPQPARARRTAGPKPEPRRPPPPETFQEPPRTEYPFPKPLPEAPSPATEPATPAPPAAPAPGGFFDGKNTWLTCLPPKSEPPGAAASGSAPPSPRPAASPPGPTPQPQSPWTPPPPQRRATDPPRPTGPNWARLFER
jgi:hypothetical protein